MGETQHIFVRGMVIMRMFSSETSQEQLDGDGRSFSAQVRGCWERGVGVHVRKLTVLSGERCGKAASPVGTAEQFVTPL